MRKLSSIVGISAALASFSVAAQEQPGQPSPQDLLGACAQQSSQQNEQLIIARAALAVAQQEIARLKAEAPKKADAKK